MIVVAICGSHSIVRSALLDALHLKEDDVASNQNQIEYGSSRSVVLDSQQVTYDEVTLLLGLHSSTRHSIALMSPPFSPRSLLLNSMPFFLMQCIGMHSLSSLSCCTASSTSFPLPS